MLRTGLSKGLPANHQPFTLSLSKGSSCDTGFDRLRTGGFDRLSPNGKNILPSQINNLLDQNTHEKPGPLTR